MTETTAELLARLRTIVADAKGVPMSASCMVNRAEVLALLDEAGASLDTDLADADQVVRGADERVEDAEREADRILRDARAEAARQLEDHELVVAAREQGLRIKDDARSEANALAREVDAFIESRLAEFEAGLHRTQTAVTTMRQRLADRAGLDDTDVEPLPPVGR